MATIGVLLGKDFEDIEYSRPAEEYLKSGHRLIHVGVEEGIEVIGKQGEARIVIEKSIDDATVSDFDALFIPGGYSPDNLRVNDRVVDFVRDFVLSGKPVFAICHAAQLFISADVIRGVKITGYQSIVQDIKNAGADYIDEPVVRDQNIITSRNPNDIPAFIDETLRELEA